MVENFLMGAGCKLLGTFVSQWLHNSSEERKANALRDELLVKAHVELAKITNADKIASCTRAIIYISITLTWCYMGFYGMSQQGTESTVLVPNDAGIFGKLFHSQTLRPVEIKGTTLYYQWWEIMQMIMGAFVMPNRRG